MKRIIVVCLTALMGAGTFAFAQDLSHASEGRLSIGMIGSTVSQVVTDHQRTYTETYRVQPDHTLTMINKVQTAG